jgi:hypothetical protein
LEDEAIPQTGINCKKGIGRCYTRLKKALQLWVDAINKRPELVKDYTIDLKFKVNIASEGSIQESSVRDSCPLC